MDVRDQLPALTVLSVEKLLPGAVWIGGWVDLKVDVEPVENRIYFLYQESNIDSLVVQLLTHRYSY
jgi:hypothetical protein